MGMSYLRPFPVQILKNLCLLAIPTGVESFSYNLSQMIILGIVNSFGTLVTVTKGYCTIFANIDYVYADGDRDGNPDCAGLPDRRAPSE